MNKMMIQKWIAMLMVIAVLCGVTCAETVEETTVDYGNMPERGLILARTQADVDMGIEVATYMEMIAVDGEEVKIPTIVFQYVAPEATETLYMKLDEMYINGVFDAYEDTVLEYFDRCHTFARIFLTADEKTEAAFKEQVEGLTLLGENDGYTYMLLTYDTPASEKDDPAIVEAARSRVEEMIRTIQYQPVVIPEEEWADEPETEVPNAFPAFATQDLNGNAVDNSIFAGAELTVVNIWGTTCYPCITEMPELQEWCNAMPENVQLIGLVLDVPVGNAEAIETAQMICEATGVTYTNLLLSEDLYEFANGIIFTPTTIFVDGNGSIVGEPVTGAYVESYKAFVEEYFNAQ